MPNSSPLSYNAEEVRRFDRDRFLTTLFAPAERREALFALYAFNIEVARVREMIREPLLGRMRLQWWRDTLASLYRGDRLAHPIAQPLGEAIRRYDLSQPAFERLIDTRETDLGTSPPDDLAGLEAYAEGTAATLNQLVLQILGVAEDAAHQAARHSGIAWALTGLLRAVPFHASTQRLYLPLSLLAEHDVAPEDVMAGKGSSGLAAAGAVVARRARQHLEDARRYRRAVPRAALPGLLTAPLADRYLDALRGVKGDLMDTRWSRTKPRPLRLAWHALRGTY